MRNRDTRAARIYHSGTKHSSEHMRSEPHFLDWSNQPLPFKIYRDLEPVPLPAEPGRAQSPALISIKGERERRPRYRSGALSLEVLARMFFLTAGITKSIEFRGGRQYYRAAPCTGALYHIETYLVCGEIPGERGFSLSAGVYHLAVHDYALRMLRRGDHRGFLAEAAGLEEVPHAAFVFTSVYWRNAWK